MNIATDPIHLLDRLEYQPQPNEIPPHVFNPGNLTIAGLYAGALDCHDQDAADEYLRGVAIHHLRFLTVYEPEEKRIRQCTLREAFHEARVGLWWYALARDVGCGDAFYRTQHNEWVTVERRTAREHVERLFGCTDPLKSRVEDMADKAYSRLEKRAQSSGVVPWRKHGKAQDEQPALF